ncbi:HNH endonuclease [Luteococcus sp. Sow4_B9]|uniref:HNH endonuclease n=1 Tax=Luteococcus sp. Sow4_B9 TaxID=3438792 RepID=UPI003F978F02
MEKAYNNLLVGGSGCDIYDKILASAKLTRCTYCERLDADTLDHFLPISSYSALGLDPWNLIPACQACNKKLLALTADTALTEHIHPYFWRDDARWLSGKVLRYEEPLIDFFVSAPDDWDGTTTARVVNYFTALNLRGRYMKASAGRVIEVADSLLAGTEVHAGDLSNAPEVLLNSADKDANKLGENHWGVVLQRTLAADSWFCDVWLPRYAEGLE